MSTLNSIRYRVPHRPAAALQLVSGLDRSATVLLHGVADGTAGAEVIVSTDGAKVMGDHDSTERETGTVLDLHEHFTSYPEEVVHFQAFRWLGRGSQIQDIVNFQTTFGVQALGINYARVHPHELCATEYVDAVFRRVDAPVVHALSEHLQVRDWRVKVSDPNVLGTHGNLFDERSHHAGERHVLHVAPGPGIAADLQWSAHRSGVKISEMHAIESDSGVAMIVSLDAAKGKRKDFVRQMQHLLNSPVRHRRARAAGTVSHGKIWVEARSSVGGNLRLTEMVARKGLPFSYLQTGSDRSSDALHGVLDAKNRHVRTVCHGLAAWGKEHRVEVQAHVLSDDGLGLEHNADTQ